MRRPVIRRVVAVFFVLNLLALTWPVASFFSAAEPFVFGLPLSLAWPVGWIILGFIMLLVLDRAEQGGGES
ncbi:hypothetical protein [Wenzhouxiangella marina]|uniref:Uncharacterized protein n=1 Tax=Wenzhouxiangella marina TaxID=1579979 RepID=A0A0K0XY03_9GAMM|nr:hypothetical protein [Wenzhouxiangella marina]AKS42563.1 hypothetical protein WM2015_2200 [Wenzhouxiangella marina]MBB6085655.1 hypothetical protein [Wenzhouxiangella marina]